MPDPNRAHRPPDPATARDLAHLREGDRLLAAGDPRGALPFFAKAIGGPLAAYAGLRRGEALHAIGEFDQARAALDTAAAAKPGDAPILFALANVDRAQGRWADAEARYRAAMRASPDALAPVVNLAGLLRQTGRHAECRTLLAGAIARRDDAAVLHDSLGLLELDGGDQAAAERAFRAALAREPARAPAKANLAEALAARGAWAEAVALLDAAIPGLTQAGQAKLNRAYARMALGDWPRAWADYESRFDRPSMAAAPRRPAHFALPRWTGAPLAGRLFVWGEQGVGDEILCASQLDAARSRCGGLVIETEPRLASLFARSFPGDRILARSDAPPPADCVAQIPAGSLMGALGWTPAAAAPRAFLRADPQAAAAAARHRRPGRRLIGLSWASGAAAHGASKSLAPEQLSRLVASSDAVFLDLQYGDTEATRHAVATATGIVIAHDDAIDLRADLDGLAALAAACDAVVTISNVTAHVAGALGIETHVLLPEGQALFWYWMDRDGGSPFYPRACLHRRRDGDWAPAIDAVRAALGLDGGPS